MSDELISWIEKYKMQNFLCQDSNFRKLDQEFFEELLENYDQRYGTIDIHDDGVWIHTGGWSENEEIIWEMRATVFWMRHWFMSKRGGHYYFTYKVEDDDDS